MIRLTIADITAAAGCWICDAVKGEQCSYVGGAFVSPSSTSAALIRERERYGHPLANGAVHPQRRTAAYVELYGYSDD